MKKTTIYWLVVKKLFFLTFLTLLILTINSCEKTLPADLEAERITLNSKIVNTILFSVLV